MKIDRHVAALSLLKNGTVILATPLALTAGRKFNERRQKALARYYMESGAGGLAVGVHTTQFAIRDPQIGLYEPVLRVMSDEISAFEEASGRTLIRIAGVCGPVDQAVREAEIAKRLGYDALLLSPGGLNLDEQAMLDRTRAAASILPIIGFYLQPAVGGRIFTFDYWRKFCEIENVVAIKSAPFNRYQTLDVVRAVATSSRADNITLYTGNDDNIVVDLLTNYRFTVDGNIYEKRFKGGLLGHWAVWTSTSVKLFKEIMKAAQSGQIPADLLTLAAEITDANAAIFDSAHNFAGCIAGIHEVLRRQGLLEGIWCLDENETLSPGQLDEIDRVYTMYPHLNDDQFVSDNLDRWLCL